MHPAPASPYTGSLPHRQLFYVVHVAASWDTQIINKLRVIKPTLKSWPSSYCRIRRDEVSLCRIRIGHTYVTHKYLLCGEDKPECPLCRVPLTVAHFLLRCPRHSVSRRRHLGHITTDVTLRHLLGDDSVWIKTGTLLSHILDIKFPVNILSAAPPHNGLLVRACMA